jgi:hypothetical protein
VRVSCIVMVRAESLYVIRSEQKGKQMLKSVERWSGIESLEINSDNWAQMAFRFTDLEHGESHRIYKVFGSLGGSSFSEEFFFDDTKAMAYDFYWEKQTIMENGSVSCIECSDYATNAEFANAVSQTGGYCLDCAPDPEDQDAIRWY